MQKNILILGLFIFLNPPVACATSDIFGLANSPWPDYGGGLRNTHQTSAVGPEGMVRVLWDYDIVPIEGSFNLPFRQPALGEDGTIYFATYTNLNGQLTALHADGSVKWRINTGLLGSWLALGNNGDLYHEAWNFSSGNSSIVSRRQIDGALNWSLQRVGEGGGSGPSITEDGTVLTVVGGLTAISPIGAQEWQVAAPYRAYRNPAVASDGTVYLDGQAVLSAYTSTGAELWTNVVGTQLGPVSIAENGNLFVGNASGLSHSLFSFTPSGIERWRRTELGGVAAIGPDGTIYAGYEGTLHALNPDTGVDLWTFETGRIDEFGVEGVTIDALGNIYIANAQGKLMSLTPKGRLRWLLDLAPNIDGNVYPGAPVIGANGVVYVAGGLTAKVFAIGVPAPGTCVLLVISALGPLLLRRKWGDMNHL